ncbi:MAG: ATPase [Sphingobium sp.]
MRPFHAALLAGLPVLAMSWAADAKVASSSDVGFAVQDGFDLASGDAAAVYALIATPARWWNAAHSYSGNAANLTIDPRAGGCFCEAVPARDGKPAGSVEHARVVYAAPGEELRLSGALGPLQSEAVTGSLGFKIAPQGKGGLRVTMTYVVGGYARMPMSQLAPLVDQVLSEQVQSLRRAAQAGRP